MKANYKIDRFTDKQVLTEISNDIAEIERYLECLEIGRSNKARLSTSTPSPRQRGIVHYQGASQTN